MKKYIVIVSLLLVFTLYGCGGGGSTNSVSVSPEIKAAINPNPTIFDTGKNILFSYSGNVTTIPYDSALPLFNGSLPSSLLSYNAGVASNYNLSSVAPILSANDDIKNKRLINKAIIGLIYVSNSQLIKIDGYTMQTTKLSSTLPQIGDGTFCGFWNGVIDYSTATNYIVYMTSSICSNSGYSPNFYIVSTNDTVNTSPRKIDTPVAALKDGWIVSKPKYNGTIEFYKCNFDCSNETLIGSMIDESNGSVINSPFAGVQAYPFQNQSTLTTSDYTLFYTSNQGSSNVFLYVNSTGKLYLTSFPDGASHDIGNSSISALFEDQNFFYLFFGVTSNIYAFSKNPDNSIPVSNNYFTVGYYPSSSIDSISQTSDYIFIKANAIGNSQGQNNFNGGTLAIYKNNGNLSSIITHIQNPIDNGNISSVFSNYGNNILYTIHSNESNGSYIKYFTFDNQSYSLKNSGYLAGYYSDGVTPYRSFLAGFIETDDTNGYIPNQKFAIATVDSTNQTLSVNSLNLNTLDVNIGSVNLDTNHSGLIPSFNFNNNIGAFSMTNLSSPTEAILYGFDINTANSLQCFYQC